MNWLQTAERLSSGYLAFLGYSQLLNLSGLEPHTQKGLFFRNLRSVFLTLSFFSISSDRPNGQGIPTVPTQNHIGC